MENMEYKGFKAKIEYDDVFHKAIDNYLEKREQIDALRGIE